MGEAMREIDPAGMAKASEVVSRNVANVIRYRPWMLGRKSSLN